MSVIDDGPPQPEASETIPVLLAFLDDIGIGWEFATVDEGSFLPGLCILGGRLRVDRTRLKYPGDILHEAAHIAVTPASERHVLGPEGLMEPGLEIAALAWSYAACVHLRLPPELVFHSGGYKGASNSIIHALSSGGTLGQPLLAWMDLTEWGADADPEFLFPRMRKWLRD